MSITNAMASGVSGLMANSSAVEKISYNIANADTVGYRRSFTEMVTAAGNGSQAVGVSVNTAQDTTSDGSYNATGITTNMAISGAGFFVVNSGLEAGTPNMLTRVGSFAPNEDGFLVNSAGNYLMGFAYDDNGNLGAVDRSSYADLVPMDVSGGAIAGAPTGNIGISGNLPSQETGQASPGDAYVSSVTYYDALGNSQKLTFSYQPTATDNSWELTVSDADTDYGTVTIDFNASGASAGSPSAYGNVISSAAAPAGFAVDPATGQMTLQIDVGGGAIQTVTVDLGAPGSFDGLTQFSGDYTPFDVDADGSESGVLSRVEVDTDGTLYGIYDNGNRIPLYAIPLATVANPNGLATDNNSTYSLSNASGEIYLGDPGTGGVGAISSGGVESSNVDLAEELTSLIQRQRAYSSNAKIITTSNEMLEETVNLKR